MPESSRERLLQSIQSRVQDVHALGADCYRDPESFALEVEHVLRPGWHAVARWDDLSEPGDYAAVDLCGEPLMIVRDEARRLRVFSRVCRHRAHTLVEGSGNTKRFVCPYHHWTYGLDGDLRAAPLMKGTAGFDPARCSLPELATDSWQGFVLASLDPHAEPISARLGALDEKLTPHGLAEMVSVGVLDFDSPWNWKVMVDNFMESYHHPGAHAQTLQKTNPAKGTYCMDLDGPFSLLENPGTSGAPDFYVGQVFPTLLFALFRGSPVGSWYEMQIDRHDHIQLRIHMIASPDFASDEASTKGLVEAARAIHLEDIAVCERVQRGLSSRLYEPGPLNRREGALARFHQHLAERLGVPGRSCALVAVGEHPERADRLLARRVRQQFELDRLAVAAPGGLDLDHGSRATLHLSSAESSRLERVGWSVLRGRREAGAVVVQPKTRPSPAL